MEVPNLSNFPVYVYIPGNSEEVVQQISGNEQLSYNLYVPNVEHHVPVVNTQSVQPIVSLQSNTNSTKKISQEKKTDNITVHYNHKFNNTSKRKYVNNLSLLLNDEDIQNSNKEVVKYDPKTDKNVVFHLMNPSDLEVNPEIKMPKRGRPRKVLSESTIRDTKQDETSNQFKSKEIIEYPLVSTKSGRLCKPPQHLLKGEKFVTKKNSFLITDNDDVVGRKKVKYNVKADFVCDGCDKTYLGYKRMQEHLEKFPDHRMNTSIQQVDSEFQNIFQKLHETPANIDLINGKKETHTQTEVLKDRHCGYLKSKKNLPFHLKQITKNLKRSSLVKSLSETISVWDLLSSPLENGNLQAFSKELYTLMLNLKSFSKSLKFISKCESNPTDSNQMFIDDSLGNFFGLPKGSYSLQNIQNEYEVEEVPNVWDLNSTKESKMSTNENINHHSSPIHLNIFDPQSSKVDFLLSSSMEESIMCDENQVALESVDGLVSERLCTMSDHLHSNVPIIDYPITSTSSTSNVSQPDSFMGHEVYEVFNNDLNLVPTSTEDFIKSLEQFEPLNDTHNSLSTETRMLDFEDLQDTFHTA